MSSERSFDTMWHGLVPGLLFPLIALLIFWQVRYDGTLPEFMQLSRRMDILPKLISLAAIPNLLLFFIYIWLHRSFSARGVIFATLLLAFAMLVLKFA